MSEAPKRVLVTGGGAGIGLAIAQAFRATGNDVRISGRDETKLKQSGFAWLAFDVSDPQSVAAALRDAGQIDIFVANAGGAETAPALKTPREMWDRMLALNLSSAFHCAQAAIPPMVARGWGRFIVVGSTASLKGYRYASAYAAAKHGVLGFVRSLALELAGTGVTANALCPGYTDTPMLGAAIDAVAQRSNKSRAEAEKMFSGTNPMKRLVAPHEVAAAALWLAGENSGSVNGQAVAIDGGETA